MIPDRSAPSSGAPSPYERSDIIGRSDLPPHLRHLLRVIAAHVGGRTDTTIVGHARLAGQIGISRRTVARQIEALEQRGMLAVDRKHRTHRYHILWDRLAPTPTCDTAMSHVIDEIGDTCVTHTRTPASLTGDTGVPDMGHSYVTRTEKDKKKHAQAAPPSKGAAACHPLAAIRAQERALATDPMTAQERAAMLADAAASLGRAHGSR